MGSSYRAKSRDLALTITRRLVLKNTLLNPKTAMLILLSVLFSVPFVLIGCGVLDNNSQPEIELITDKTLGVGDERAVDVYITDADVDDIHTINASSDNPSVAMVSVNEDFLTITGNAVGEAIITVSATDDSGQNNAEAIPVTFKVVVNEPPPSVQIGFGINQPLAYIDKGACTVGMNLKPGEGCSYDSTKPFVEIIFAVREDGAACREEVLSSEGFGGQLELPEQLQPRNLRFCVEWDIERDDFFETSFAASRNPDGSWTVKNVP